MENNTINIHTYVQQVSRYLVCASQKISTNDNSNSEQMVEFFNYVHVDVIAMFFRTKVTPIF